MQALAYAKINLGLRVGRVRPDGFHPLHSLFQSIDLADRLELRFAEVHDADGEAEAADRIAGWSGGEAIDGFGNLAWRAIDAVRSSVGDGRSLHLRLDKQIPVAAGLGGGSADAAAALHLAVRWYGAPSGLLDELAPTLGSDVPFCVQGGTARVSGRGDHVEPLDPILGYGLGLVVPPIELSTPAVYRRWDDVGGPTGAAFPPAAVPPTLRHHTEMANDLYRAAISIAPSLDDWRNELEAAWGRPVFMSGSGPTLAAFFLDREEAEAAVGTVPPGVRAVMATEPISAGWRIVAGDGAA